MKILWTPWRIPFNPINISWKFHRNPINPNQILIKTSTSWGVAHPSVPPALRAHSARRPGRVNHSRAPRLRAFEGHSGPELGDVQSPKNIEKSSRNPYYLVVEPPLWNVWKSIGMTIPHPYIYIYWLEKWKMFQTTDQHRMDFVKATSHNSENKEGWPWDCQGKTCCRNKWIASEHPRDRWGFQEVHRM